MTRNKSVRRWADRTRTHVLAGGWNQFNGWVAKDAADEPCCIGVKLAIAYAALNARDNVKGYDYTDGMDAANADLGGDDDQLEAALTAVCRANGLIWKVLYGIDVRGWPELNPTAFWQDFELAAARHREGAAALRQDIRRAGCALHRRDGAEAPVDAPAEAVPA